MEIHNFLQQSPEWFAIRKGKMTASHAQAIGSNGAGLKTYIMELMAEYYSKGIKEGFSNRHTERGNELEDSASMVYEFETGLKVEKVGFITMNEYVGCSPDRLVGDGLLEIKSPDDKEYFNILLNKKIESKYIWQMNAQMQICEKKWCDFMAYNPNFDKDSYIERVYPDPEKFKALEIGYAAGIKMIEEIKNKIK